MQNRSFHARHELNDSRVAYVLDEPVNDFVPKLPVRHLAAAEAKARFHLVALVQESDRLVLLGLVVVFVNRDGELHFLDYDDLLLLACRSLALFLLVKIASIVLDAADRRNRIGRNLNQVQTALTRYL